MVEGVKKYIPKYHGLLKEWKRQWGEKDVIILNTDIFNRMKKQTNGGEQFKRDLVVFVISTLLNGRTNLKPYHRILKSFVISTVLEVDCSSG